VGAITTRIGIRIGHFTKEYIAGSIISFECGGMGLQVVTGNQVEFDSMHLTEVLSG
jgi:hypothetical protein